MDLGRTAEIFNALGNEKRLAIVLLLKDNPCLCVNEIVEQLNIAQATVSQHLKILKMAEIVQGKRSNQKVCYQISNKKIITMLNNCFKK